MGPVPHWSPSAAHLRPQGALPPLLGMAAPALVLGPPRQQAACLLQRQSNKM